MKKGKIEKIDWNKYKAPDLNLRLPNKKDLDCISCGSISLSILTGLSPKFIEKYCPNPKHGWYTSRIKKFLLSRGYTVLDVTKRNVTNTVFFNYPVTSEHCLLLLMKVDKDDYSTFIAHKNSLWHNFDDWSEDYNPLLFINKPVEDVMVIWHPKWNKQKKSSKCVEKP